MRFNSSRSTRISNIRYHTCTVTRFLASRESISSTRMELAFCRLYVILHQNGNEEAIFLLMSFVMERFQILSEIPETCLVVHIGIY